MAAFVGQRVRVKDFGSEISVPEDPKAKLMYYLDCVALVIQLNDPNLRRLRDYGNFSSLTEAETDALLALVILLSPDELIGKVFFPSEDIGGGSNKFYELNEVSHMFAVTDNILIGGERKRVAKVMLFTRLWLEYSYLVPLRSFQSRLQRMARGLPGRAPPPPPPPRNSSCNIQ
ncbi:uncharacterized protein [Montipora foliosa]|uniref:uncharacterized protein n=1 Tax=Montipora foliosa TaxID=591990 RepID=UPI0035F141FA